MNVASKNILNMNDLQSIAQLALKEASRSKADQVEVSLAANKGYSVTAHGGDVETISYNQDKIFEVTVYFGKRSGSASASDIRAAAIRTAVEAACHIAKFTDMDSAAGLADKEELAFGYPTLALAYPWPISVEEAIQLACQCEQEALAQDKRIVSVGEATVSTVEAINLYANSHGFLGFYPYTRHEISCVLIAKKGDEMQRDYYYTVSPDPRCLESVSVVAKQAAARTVQRLGARKLPTMKVPVIFIAEEARGLLGHFASAISGSSIYRKSSFLADQLDKPLFPAFMQIKEYPHLARAAGSTPFDDDGVATRANTFVESGTLCNYALSVYSARKLGMKTTGNAGGVHNLIVETSQKNLSELLKTMDKGLLITETMGQGVNLVTGDYSRGIGGFWVENGEIQYPVQEVTVAGKLPAMYSQIVAVANDVDTRGGLRTGSILIEEMMEAGT